MGNYIDVLFVVEHFNKTYVFKSSQFWVSVLWNTVLWNYASHKEISLIRSTVDKHFQWCGKIQDQLKKIIIPLYIQMIKGLRNKSEKYHPSQ